MSDYDFPPDMTPENPDWPRKPDGSPLPPGAAAAVLRGRGGTVQSSGGGGGGPRRAKSDGPGDSYVEVKERIQVFYATYPTGSIVTNHFEVIEAGDFEHIVVQAQAFRDPDDKHPGTGTSWMRVPGTTPYTKGSEMENAETSAWGRAIAAVGILVDRGIASASEIRAKGEGSEAPSRTNADVLAAAAEAAARPGRFEDQGKDIEAIAAVVPTAVAVSEPNGTTETPAEPDAGTEAPTAPEEPSPVKEEATLETTDGAPVNGISQDEFVRLSREKFIPKGHLSLTARDLASHGHIRQVGKISELNDSERFTLLMAALATQDEAPAQDV